MYPNFRCLVDKSSRVYNDYWSSPPDIIEDLARPIDQFNDLTGSNVPRPKIPLPWTNPGEAEKDIESAGALPTGDGAKKEFPPDIEAIKEKMLSGSGELSMSEVESLPGTTGVCFDKH